MSDMAAGLIVLGCMLVFLVLAIWGAASVGAG